MGIGDIIASERRKQRIGQVKLAKTLNISVSYLCQIENCQKKASKLLLKEISNALKVPVSVLLFQALKEKGVVTNNEEVIFWQSKGVFDKMIDIFLN